MGSCATEDKACGNQPTNTRMIYRRPISPVVPDPQSLTEKTKNRENRKNNRHLLTGQSIPGAQLCWAMGRRRSASHRRTQFSSYGASHRQLLLALLGTRHQHPQRSGGLNGLCRSPTVLGDWTPKVRKPSPNSVQLPRCKPSPTSVGTVGHTSSTPAALGWVEWSL
jgi:hypothetical protein